jgi:5-(carboxyamino)imidazole ribonucleotide synthase
LSEAAALASKIAEALGLVGIVAVEMFLTKDNRLVVNELAPRPHNSGHHTIETAITSQYEQLVRAILGMPLGETALTSQSLMMNIIAESKDAAKQEYAFKQLLGMKGVHLHWYGKRHHKPGRKIGHITIRGGGNDNIYSIAKQVREILNQQ